jgi:hypothetical protein
VPTRRTTAFSLGKMPTTLPGTGATGPLMLVQRRRQVRSVNFGMCRRTRMSDLRVPIRAADVTFGMCRRIRMS